MVIEGSLGRSAVCTLVTSGNGMMVTLGLSVYLGMYSRYPNYDTRHVGSDRKLLED
jgi:hypothetical protein